MTTNEARRGRAHLPATSVLVAAIKDGATVADLAVEYGANPASIACKLNRDGYRQDGEPSTRSSHLPSGGLFEDQPWAVDALCAQTDPEAFFPEKGGSTKEGKRICMQCEVRAECLIYALDHDERFGIWGGLSERERRRLKAITPSPQNGSQEVPA